ncbi:hypothetical protein ACFFHM_20145 [Halalkalibacter kiskunsagensis]|uniref:Holin n=1 Tax=Halalkalibacter kiskunsagensis TaxID=1548599 RepID=A0ABV6KHD7_9BACI
MIGKVIVLLVLYTVLLLFDFSRLKKNEKQVIYIYSIIIGISFYLSVDFILQVDWPNLKDLINAVFLGPAQRIVDYFMGK